jgi:glutamate-ammonia-ligase adenylyltransferase
MALTRARVIAGDERIGGEAEQIISAILNQKPDRKKIAADVLEMRDLIDKEKPPRDIWDVKLIPGGLVDIEFIAQYLSLIAPDHGVDAAGRDPNTEGTLRRLGPALMSPADLDTVLGALELYSNLAQIIRLCIDGPFDPKEAPEGLRELLCRVGDAPDLKVLESEVRRYSQAVRAIFKAVISARR